jgi:hypothetical protein
VLRIPSSAEFEYLPFAEKIRITNALRDLLRQYAMSEREDTFAARERVLRGIA